MKVLIDARLYGLENAGLGRYTMELVRHLSASCREFEFVIFLRKKYFEELVLPSNWKKVCVDIRHYSFVEQLFLPFLIHRENPDLVHFVHFNVPIFYFGKFLVTIHDLLMNNFYIQSTTLPIIFYFIKRLGYRLVFSKAIYSSCAIITPSFTVKEEILKFFDVDSKKVIALHEGVSNRLPIHNVYKSKIVKKYGIMGNYILYCGNAYPHKNLDFVLETISSYSFKREFLFVLVLPRSIFRQRIERKVSALGLSSKVIILDFVPDKDLFCLMHNSLAYIFPSLSEGFGLPGLEALSAGTLLIASDIPVFREIYKNVPIYFNPKRQFSLKKSLDRVLAMSVNQRQVLIEKGKKLANSYSWSKMAKNVAEIYSKFAN